MNISKPETKPSEFETRCGAWKGKYAVTRAESGSIRVHHDVLEFRPSWLFRKVFRRAGWSIRISHIVEVEKATVRIRMIIWIVFAPVIQVRTRNSETLYLNPPLWRRDALYQALVGVCQ